MQRVTAIAHRSTATTVSTAMRRTLTATSATVIARPAAAIARPAATHASATPPFSTLVTATAPLRPSPFTHAPCLPLRTFSSASRGSALITPQQQIDAELALSTQRRLERQKRLEELEALESALRQHQAEEQASAWGFLRRILHSHGAVIAAVVCGIASMSASFALWKAQHLHTKEMSEIQSRVDLLRAQRQDLAQLDQREAHEAADTLQRYLTAKTAIVSTPKPSTTTPPVFVHKSHSASKSDLAKLTQLRTDIEQAYAQQ